MSWLGGLNDSFNQISSLTGQIGGQLSNFTKEVLTEGTGETIDYEIEAKSLQKQLLQHEADIQEREALIAHLREENEVLKDKVQSAELHISTSGIEYEARLHKKNNEITQLKQKLSSYGETLHQDASPRGIESSIFSSVSLNDDDDDFHDVIYYQRQVTRLSQELEDARSEIGRLKEKANSPNASQGRSHDRLGRNAEEADGSMLNRIRELEDVLRREADHHQQEIRTMQDAHDATVNRYQEEVRKLKPIAAASSEDSQVLPGGGDFHSLRQDIANLHSDLQASKEQLRTRNRQIQAQKKQLDEANAKLQDAVKGKGEKEQENLSLQGKIQTLCGENEQNRALLDSNDINMRAIFTELQGLSSVTGVELPSLERASVTKALRDVRDLHLRLVDQNSQAQTQRLRDQDEIRRLGLQVVKLQEAAESNAVVERNQQMVPEGDSMYDLELAESDQWHQDGVEEDKRRGKLVPAHLDFGHPLSHSSPQVTQACRRGLHDEDSREHPLQEAPAGDLTLTLQALQKQVEDYELEIEQYEQVQSEWQHEKKSLQDLLNRYQKEVTQPEQANPQPEDPEDDRAASVAALRREMEELRGARENLGMEKMRLVQEKEQLQVAAKNLQEELNSSISEAQVERGQVESLKHALEEHSSEKVRLQTALENITEELNRSRMEKDELGESLEALDSQHQDEMVQLLKVRDELKEQLKSAQNQIKLEQDEKENLAKVSADLKQEVFTLSHGNKKSENEAISTLENQLSQEKLKNEKLELKLHDVRLETRQLCSKLESGSSQILALKQELDVVSSGKDCLVDKITFLENSLRSKDEEERKFLSALDCVRKENASLKQEIEEERKILDDSLEESELKHQEESEKSRHEIALKMKEKDSIIENLQMQLENNQETMRLEEESLQKEDESASLEDSLITNHEIPIQDLRKLIFEKDEKIMKLENIKTSVETQDALSTKLHEREEELGSLRKSLDEKVEEITSLSIEKQQLEEKLMSEISRFQEENDSLGQELENSGKEVALTQSLHQEEIRRLQTQHHEALTKVEEENDSFKIEAETTTKVYIEKISHLEKAIDNLQKQLEEATSSLSQEEATSNLNKNWESKLSRIQQDNNDLVTSLKEQNINLSEQFKLTVTECENLKTSMAREHTAFEAQLKMFAEQRMQMQQTISSLQNEMLKLRDSENMWKGQLAQAERQIASMSEKLSNTKTNVAMDKNSLPVTDSKSHPLEVQKLRSEYETRVDSLMEETEELKRRLAMQATTSISPNIDLDNALEEIRSRDIAGLEKSDLSKDDIGSLLQLIKERDEVISIMTQQRASFGRESTASLAAIRQLEDANRSLSAEKDQILAVISEKTRENKKLKDEAHRMMNIVAEEKAALAKVLQENAALQAKYEGYDREMTKEAVGKLSRLVQEKELEIESLKQKCGTLLEVLQQQPQEGSTPADIQVSGQQVQSLLHDKEILSQQVHQLLNERNHLVALLNQRMAEVEESRNEVSKAAEALERDADDNSKLQISFGNLVHDYEQSEMKLRAVQKELALFKEKLNHLEETKEVLMTKIELMDVAEEGHMVNGSMENGTDSQTNVIKEPKNEPPRTILEKEILSQRSNQQETEHQAEMERMSNDMREKDILIHSRTEEISRVKRQLAGKSNEVEILRKSVENLREQVATFSRNCEESRDEVKKMSSRLSEKNAEAEAFQETNAQLSMLLKEKEYEVENARDKSKRLESMVHESQQGKESESQRLLVELDEVKQKLIAAKHERDQVMLSMKQRKLEADKYSEEARMLREKEMKLESELARLRNHLIQVEEAYTQEAMLAEDREKVLQEQLQKIQTTNSAAKEATELSQQQAESLQEQLRTAIGQRDQAIQQLQLTQEQGMQYATALQKLQIAVEQMQREDAASFAEQMEKVQRKFEQRNGEACELESQVVELKEKLDDANEALSSASRLNKQLELKEEHIEQLKSIVAEKQLAVDELQDRIHHMTTKNEAMVDKEIVKNLFIGYFTSPSNKRDDVMHLITGVLSFSSDEVAKVESGGSSGGRGGWIGGWLWRGGKHQGGSTVSVPNSPRSNAVNESFTQMFVKFLESESVPHHTAKLPAASMVNEAQQRMNQRKVPRSPGISSVPTPVGTTASERAAPMVAGRYSPFLLTSTVTSTPSKGQGPIFSSAGHPLMMHPITPMLPTFTPIANPKPQAERELLHDILHSGGEK